MKYILCLCVLMAVIALAKPDGACSSRVEIGRPGTGCRAGYRYFYYPLNNACVRLFYFGCNGNGNNFPTQSICESKCKKSVADCNQPFSLGVIKSPYCRSRTQFFYSARSKSCYPFLYRGCDGTSNRFDSYWQCMNTCKRG